MCLADRIKELSTSKKMSLTVLEQTLGFGNGTIGKWRKQSPSCDKLKLVADYLSTSIDYLITGKEKSPPTNDLSADERELLTYYKKLPDKEQGKLLGRAEALAEAVAENQNVKPDIRVSVNPCSESEKIYIEFYDLPVSAGTGIYLDNSDCDMLEVDETPLTAEANFALKIQGDSMEPKFRDGDIILIRTQPCVEIGEIGIFIINNAGYVKKFEGDRLVSLNQKYDDIVFEEYDEIYCKGKVIGKL